MIDPHFYSVKLWLTVIFFGKVKCTHKDHLVCPTHPQNKIFAFLGGKQGLSYKVKVRSLKDVFTMQFPVKHSTAPLMEMYDSVCVFLIYAKL